MAYTFLDTVLIVDGASTACYLAPAFRANGVNCVHVISSPDFPSSFQKFFKKEDYVRQIEHDGDMESTLWKLRDLRIGAVLHGLDAGLVLADALAERLEIPSRNPAESSLTRRDKFMMIDRIRKAGLRAPMQFHSASVDDVMAWARAQRGLPLVVKPARSAGVSGVKICRTLEQVDAAARHVLATRSIYNHPNDDIVVQSYSEGQEYIVDSVSFGGKHRVVSLWEVHRDRVHAPRLDRMLLVNHDDSQYVNLLNYAKEALNALDVRFGPSHLELINTIEGPVVVELNSRLHGSLDLRLTTAVTGENHVSATVGAILDSERMFDVSTATRMFRGSCGHVLLRSPCSGMLNRDFPWQSIRDLPSFVGLTQTINAGDRIELTVDLTTSLGTVSLYAESNEQLNEDCQRIRAIELEFFEKRENVTTD